MTAVSAQTRANRVAGAKKAAATRKALAAVRAFMATGAPLQAAPERGTARGDFSPSEIIERIRAASAPGGGGGG